MFRRRRCVVYTCLFGFSEKFIDAKYDPSDKNTDFVCFTDDEELTSERWKIVQVKPFAMDSARAAKRIKQCYYEYLTGYDMSLYIDNTVLLRVPAKVIFSLYQKNADIMLFKHPGRDCIYEEAQAIMDAGYDSSEVIQRQMNQYREMGYPEHAGLFAGGVLLRRHNNQRLENAMLEWHLQILRHSYRDQISFPVVARHFGLQIIPLPGALDNNDLIEWPYPRDVFRLPRDFNDARYFELNPQARTSGLNARKHYFQHGHREGLQYK